MRLWVPPLRLLSAFLWQVAEQRLVKYYTRLEEFVSVVLDIVPDLLSAEERVELLLGLRAKVSMSAQNSAQYLSYHVFCDMMHAIHLHVFLPFHACFCSLF